MKRILVAMAMILNTSVLAQFNLVQNPSFEVYDTCPSGFGQLKHALFWTNPSAYSTPDYFNACNSIPHGVSVPENYAGYEPAHSGVAYVGLATFGFNYVWNLPNNYREYMQTELSDSLIAGVDYCIRFYVSACDSVRWISDNIGVYFSPVEIHDSCPQGCPLTYIPQFENPANNNLNSRNGWTEISGNYTALGGEKFITIGNFRDTSSTIATFTGWSPNYLTRNFAAYYIDDVLITPCDSLTGINTQHTWHGIKIYPSVTNGSITIGSDFENIQQYIIFNGLGQMVMQKKKITNEKLINVNLDELTKGIYFLEITIRNKHCYFKLIKN